MGDLPTLSPDAGADQVVLVDHAGRRVTVPAAEAQDALADPISRFHVQTSAEAQAQADEAKFGDRPVAAGLAGLGRGLSLGLSDVALTKTGLVAPETLHGLKEHNQGATALGDAAGTVGGLLLPGLGELNAVRGVAEAGELAGRGVATALGQGLLAKAASVGARGAVEGSLYGLGNTLSENALGETQLTAEKLASSVGVGALLGIGGSELGELLGAAARPVARASAKAISGLQEKLESSAEMRALKAAGAIQKDFNKLGEGQGNKIGRDLLDASVFDGASSKADIYDRVKRLQAREGQHIGDTLEQADQMLGGGTFDLQAVVDRARKDLLAPIANDPALKSEAAKLSSLLDDYEKQAGGGIDFAEANRFKTNLQQKVSKFTDTPIAQKYTKQLSGILNDEIESQLVSQVGPTFAEDFVNAKDRYGSFKQAVKYAKSGMDREAGNRFISLSDYGVGGAAGLLAGGPLGVAASAGGALANKVLRERGPAVFANALDSLAKAPAFGTLAQGFENFAQGLLKTNPQALGAYGGVLANAAARSSAELLLTHATLSESDPEYRNTMQAAGLDYHEDPHQVGARAQALAAVGYHLNGYDEERQKALSAFLAGRSSPEAGVAQAYRLGRDTLDHFRGLSETLSTLASNPDALVERLGSQLGPIQEHAPGVATAYAATVSNALGFLNAKMPKSADPLNDVPALQRPYQPGDAELARFGRYVRAVADPSTVFEDLRHGRVTKEAVEALQAVYPRFYEDMKAQALDQLSGSKKPLDYARRVALGNLLGTPLDSSARPARVIALQQAFAGGGAPQGQPPSSGRPVKPPQSMSASQALEAGLGKG
jgi:hypothetical protein